MPSLSESFPTIGLLVSGTRKLFSRSKKQPPVEIADTPDDLFADDFPTLESKDAADLARIAYQAGAEEIPSEIEEPDGHTPEADSPIAPALDPAFSQEQNQSPRKRLKSYPLPWMRVPLSLGFMKPGVNWKRASSGPRTSFKRFSLPGKRLRF